MSYFKSIMANRKEGEYGRLKHDDEDSEVSDKEIHPASRRKISPLSFLLVSNTILALVVVGLLTRNVNQPSASTSSIPYTGVSPVQLLEDQLGLRTNVIQTYLFVEENLDDEDFMKGDPYWRALFPKGAGQVFLDDEVVAAYKLPPSLRNPAKGNYTAYFSAGYHSLHCLTGLRQIIDLRQLVFCNFDETLFAFEGDIHPGYHQKKVCKDMRPINEWLEYNYEGKFLESV